MWILSKYHLLGENERVPVREMERTGPVGKEPRIYRLLGWISWLRGGMSHGSGYASSSSSGNSVYLYLRSCCGLVLCEPTTTGNIQLQLQLAITDGLRWIFNFPHTFPHYTGL